MRKIIAILLCAILAAACSGKKTIPERKLVKILAEMHLADAALDESDIAQWDRKLRDSTAVYTAILDEYGYTVEQLYNSVKKYSKTKNDVTSLYDKVYKRLNKLQKEYAKEVEQLHKKQNRWLEKADWRFPADGDTSRLAFSVPVDSAGTYILSADITLLKEDSVNNPRITVLLYGRSCHTKSVLVDSVKRDTLVCVDTTFGQVEQMLQRDGTEQKYTLTIVNPDSLATQVRGYILNHNNDSLGLKPRHAVVKNVMLRYVLPTNDATKNEGAQKLKFEKRDLKSARE